MSSSFDHNPDLRLALTEREVVTMWNFVNGDQEKFAKLFRFLGALSQAPIYRTDLEIHVSGEPVAETPHD